MTAILARNILRNNKGAKIVHSPQLIWAVDDTVNSMGGVSILSKTGHSFVATKMKEEDAIFGGEISSHFYFKRNYYSDNGMIPMLMGMELLCNEKTKLSELLNYYREKYITSPEINYTVSSVQENLERIENHYKNIDGVNISKLDGVSIEFNDWRFNLRGSNTEPVIRLNLEARSKNIFNEKLSEVESMIN